jgi:carbonic anhydrase/acetyltransferase-like protein (isoleucine patch superfamily)
VSLARSLYLSLRFRGRFLVGRGTRVRIDRSADIEFRPGAFLLLGLHYEGTKPTLLNMGRDTRLVLRGTAQVWRGSEVVVLRGGCLDLGNRVVLNEGARIICCCQVTVGDDSGLSWNASVLDSDLHPLVLNGEPTVMDAPVTIGPHCLIGYGATVLKGVTLGEGCIVGARSVVVQDVPPRTAVAGNPARQLATDVDWT